MPTSRSSARSLAAGHRTLVAATLIAALVAVSGCAEQREADVPAGSDAAPSASVNALSEAERAEGWVLLFDGEDLAGWSGIGRDEVPEGHWVVEDGAIRKVDRDDVPAGPDGEPRPGGDLMTVEAFEDFEFVFEWKVAPGANTGVKYNVSREMSAGRGSGRSALGFEYQVIDDEGYPGELTPGQRTGSLYDLIPAPGQKTVKPSGSWNQSRIVLRDGHGEHWLNGQQLLEFDLGTPAFEEHVAASKFADVEGFAEQRAGHLVLQDHGDGAWFRNLKVRRLQD